MEHHRVRNKYPEEISPTRNPPIRSQSDISHHSRSIHSATSSHSYSSSPHQHQQQHSKRMMQKSHSSSLSHLSKEQGRILSLLDNFGFIYCAQRPCDLFFHYSEYRGSLNQLNIGDEVEFFVGPSQKSSSTSTEVKMSAFAVQKLESGCTISWQVEVEPQGLRRRGTVQKSLSSRNTTSTRDAPTVQPGKIRLQPLEDHEDNNKDKAMEEEILFQPQDLQDSTLLLERDDIVEFTLVQESRTGHYYARDIVRILSKREQMEQEKERFLLESATLEQGIVASLHGGFGFLKSNKRKERVYFKYCHVILPEVQEGEEGTENNNASASSYTLREGQEMEFYVVCENDKKDGKKSLSARQIHFLDRGSVIFEQVLAQSVIGIVETCPSFIQENDRRNYTNAVEEVKGKVLLDTPISFVPPESKDANILPHVVSEVWLYASDAPGGIIYHQEASTASLWIRKGDQLMFDVVYDLADCSCRVAPMQLEQGQKENTEPPRVRFISPSSENRFQGSVTTLKDDYGFIRLSDRNADIYFKVSNVLPRHMQEDMNTFLQTESVKELPPLRTGIAVSFDIPPQSIMNISSNKGASKSAQAKRIQILPQVIKSTAGNVSMQGWGIITEINLDINRGVISNSTGKSKKGNLLQFSLDEVVTTQSNKDRDVLKIGDEVIFELQPTGTSDIPTATNIRIVPTGCGSTILKNNSDWLGYVVHEPSSFRSSNHSSKGSVSTTNDTDVGIGRWKNVKEDIEDIKADGCNDGCILPIYYPPNFGSTCATELDQNESESHHQENIFDLAQQAKRTHLFYNTASLLHRGTGSKLPRRGELVSFTRDKNGKVKNVRVIKESAAPMVRGVIKQATELEVVAVFNTNQSDSISVVLTEISGCSLKSLKGQESVEGILYEGMIYGVCKTSDLYLSSSNIQSSTKERTRLNLTVKKELVDSGGKIIAQSSMAKGPDGSTGFNFGWTTRNSFISTIVEMPSLPSDVTFAPSASDAPL